ncbi:vps51 vps67 protein [Cystoisospora suis]|uniref:Vps51 vps67 protein n=1 Tax=Cystoisospora suis TaxID=483139 RepID=A0A2C6L400_9APIC|nr:vps51 vps67 protein [Cystoisospora suis]
MAGSITSGTGCPPVRKSKVGTLLSEYYDLDDDDVGLPTVSTAPGAIRAHASATGGAPPSSGGHPSPAATSLSSPADARGKGGSSLASNPALVDSHFLENATASGSFLRRSPSAPKDLSPGGESRQLGNCSALQDGGKTDLNSKDFDVHAYFASAVHSSSLRELLQRSGQLEEEVRRLEGELQTLVYENYGKFLEAAETVRRVKEDMQTLQGDMSLLDSRVDSIEDSSRELDELVRDRAASIEELVSFRQLLDKLQILFTFPEVLRRHLAKGDAEGAIAIYLKIHPFLAAQYGALPRLQRLQLLDSEATAIFQSAKRLLRSRLAPVVAENVPFTLSLSSVSPDSDFLPSKEASKVLMLLLQAEKDTEGADYLELLRLYHRNRTHALLHLLQVLFDHDRLQDEASKQELRQREQQTTGTVSGPRGAGSPGKGKFLPSNSAGKDRFLTEERREAGSVEPCCGMQSSENCSHQETALAGETGPSGSCCVRRSDRLGKATYMQQRDSSAATSRMLEVACSSISEQFMGPLVDAVDDTLRVVRAEKPNKLHMDRAHFDTAASDPQQPSGATRPDCPSNSSSGEQAELSSEAAEILHGFLSPLLRSTFARVLALLASTNPPPAAVVGAVDTLRVALRRLHVLLPATQQQQLSQEFLRFSDQVLQQGISLAFKESYMRAAQELGVLHAFCYGQGDRSRYYHGSPRERTEREGVREKTGRSEDRTDFEGGSAIIVETSDGMEDVKSEEALQQLARTEHAVLLQGCLTLTDIHQLVNGVCNAKSAQADRIVKNDLVAWTEGFFLLIVSCLLRLTRDTPAALQERPQQRSAAEDLRREEAGWWEQSVKKVPLAAGSRDAIRASDTFSSRNNEAHPGTAYPSSALPQEHTSMMEWQIRDAIYTAICTHILPTELHSQERGASSSQLKRSRARDEGEAAGSGTEQRDAMGEGAVGVATEGRTLLCLLMMRMGRYLELQGLAKVAAVAVELFPSFPVNRLTASSLGCTGPPLSKMPSGSFPVDKEDDSALKRRSEQQPLLLRTRWASQAALTTYVFRRGLEGSALATRALQQFLSLEGSQEQRTSGAESSIISSDDHDPTQAPSAEMSTESSASSAPSDKGYTASRDERHEKPSEKLKVVGLFDPLLALLHRVDAECSRLLGERRQQGGTSTGACVTTLMPGLSGGGGSSAEQQHQRRVARLFGRRRTALEKEMERLFSRKQPVFSQVPFSRAKAVMGIFRIASRTLLEFVRFSSFSRRAVRQLQIECAVVGEPIRDLVPAEDGCVVDGLLDEVVACALSRCFEKVQIPQTTLLHGGRVLMAAAAVGKPIGEGAALSESGGGKGQGGASELPILLEQTEIEDICNRYRRRQ